MKRTPFIALGIIMCLMAVLTNGVAIIEQQFPEHLMLIAMTVICFCLAYLAPHFEAKDERAQKIRERAVFISYFWGLSFAIICIIIVNPSFGVPLSGYHTLTLFMVLYISTVFLNMVYFARKY